MSKAIFAMLIALATIGTGISDAKAVQKKYKKLGVSTQAAAGTAKRRKPPICAGRRTSPMLAQKIFMRQQQLGCFN
jgi:hypothetical protein